MLSGSIDDNGVTDCILRCAIEVHRELGPGLLESVYERALCVELSLAQCPYISQPLIEVVYKGRRIADYRPDLIVSDRVIVEIKNVVRLEPVHTAQVMTYLRITRLRIGLLLNFNSAVMKHGIRRVVI